MSDAARALPDWGYEPGVHGPKPKGDPRFLATAGGALVLAILATRLLGLWGLVAFVTFSVGLVVLLASDAGRSTLRREKAVRIKPGTSSRAENIVSGLAPRAGIEIPQLWRIPSEDANAFVCRTTGPVIALTSGLIDTYTRTELEAVIAHCCVRLARTATLLGALRLAVTGVMSGRPPAGGADDVVAAAVTRYPPALASAISKATPRSGRGAAFWFVPDSDGERSAERRSELLLTL